MADPRARRRLAAIALIALAGCRVDFDALRDGGSTGGGGDGDRNDGAVVGGPTLTITVTGAGAVTSSPAGIACTDQCSAAFTGSVTLTAFPGGADSLASWTGTSCGAAPTCTIDVEQDTAITADFSGALSTQLNRAFVTTILFNGDLKNGGTIAGPTVADTICSNAAIGAGLTGTFVAFLSDLTSGRNATTALNGSSGWIRTDGAPLIASVADFGTYGQLVPFDRDQNGASVPAADFVWLGGDVRGFGAGSDCVAFSSALASNSADAWNARELPLIGISTMLHCNETAHLACMEIGKNAVLPGPFPVGRVAFPTSATWMGPDLASADTLCATEATTAGLAGTFVAALATTTQSISDRAGGLTGPWRTPAGTLVALGPLAFDLRAPIAPAGGRGAIVWTGGMDLTTVTTSGFDCNDWTAFDGAHSAQDGNLAWDDATWVTNQSVQCNNTLIHLLCLQR